MYQTGSGTGPSSLSKTSAEPVATLLCFSHLRWDFVYQRPQHLLTRAARDYEVLVFEEPLWEDISEPELRRMSAGPNVLRLVPVLPRGTEEAAAETIQRRFVDLLVGERADRTLALWYYTPMALPFSRHLRADLVVFDCMDELSAFRGAPPRLTELERELFARADLVFTGGQSLFEAKRRQHRSVHAFPSSIDPKHFGQARRFSGPEPDDQRTIPHPRLGFFGVIDERMDLGLVSAVADLQPDWHLVMIGPVVKIDAGNLPRRPNIHWLGGKSYSELPAYLASWDLGFMPFALNESTRFISPTKTPEYLSAGLPVVSTPVVDVVRGYGDAGLVEIAADAPAVVAAAERLLKAPRDAWLARVDQQLAQSSWDTTWNAMQQLMRAARRTTNVAGVAPKSRRVPQVEAAHV